MNEHIKNLMSESTGFTMSVYETNNARTYGERIEFFDKEKFAALLVEHITDYLTTTANTLYNDDRGAMIALLYESKEIKKRYGVK